MASTLIDWEFVTFLVKCSRYCAWRWRAHVVKTPADIYLCKSSRMTYWQKQAWFLVEIVEESISKVLKVVCIWAPVAQAHTIICYMLYKPYTHSLQVPIKLFSRPNELTVKVLLDFRTDSFRPHRFIEYSEWISCHGFCFSEQYFIIMPIIIIVERKIWLPVVEKNGWSVNWS